MRYVVELSDYAWQRYVERGGWRSRRRLEQRIESQLNLRIKIGLPVNETGGAWLIVDSSFGAVLRAGIGRWVVATVIAIEDDTVQEVG